MAKLVDQHGQPLSSSQFETRRGRPSKDRPPVGETSVNWGGDGLPHMILPDGGRVVLDPSRIDLADFRVMKSHYQINSSLTVLTFMMHQLDYKVEASNSKVGAAVEYALDKVWTRLVRAMSTAFWAGYSPNVLQWENDPTGNMLLINKVKDMVPEYCDPAWKQVDAVKLNPNPNDTLQPKSYIFDGINQRVGSGLQAGKYHIPQSNSFWYPLLMENGNMRGTQLLKSAYAPWFFSNMIHAYANSYYERFGEPVPVARAPYGEDITVDGKDVPASQFMQGALRLLRSGAAVVLPNDREPGSGSSSSRDYEYDIEYLESQMRGADFEKHLSRLDEEISLALFTPLLLMRTGDGGGGYNQGVAHMQVYLWQLNAIAADWKEYIDKYIIAPIVKYNFGGKQWARIKFRKLGTTQQETVRAILQELIRSDKAAVDIEELGFAAGLTLTEIKQVTAESDDEGGDSTGDSTGGDSDKPRQDKRIGRPEKLKDDDLPSEDKPKTTTKGLSKKVDRVKFTVRDMVNKQEILPTDTLADDLVAAGATRDGSEKFALAVRLLAIDASVAGDLEMVDAGVDHLCRKYL